MEMFLVLVVCAAGCYFGYSLASSIDIPRYKLRDGRYYDRTQYDEFLNKSKVATADDAEVVTDVTPDSLLVTVQSLNKPLATKEVWDRFMVDRELHRRRTGVMAGEKGDLLFVDWSKNNIAD